MYNKHIAFYFIGIIMKIFTDTEKETLLSLTYWQRAEYLQEKHIAELNDKRFTQQSKLDAIDKLIAKLEKL
jgi:hypothetical protein